MRLVPTPSLAPRLALPLAAALVLSACSKEADKPKSEDEVRAAAAQMAHPEPGQYRSTFKVVSFEVPGMPAAQQDRMRQMFANSQRGQEYCLTPEQAAKGFEEAMKKLPQGKCTYDRFNVSGTDLDAQLTCETGQGMKSTIGMKGTVSSTGSQLTMSMDNKSAQLPGGGMKMVAEVASQRIGDCPPAGAGQ